MQQLWTELYRPTTIKDYVFKDPGQKAQIEAWLKDKALPHMLLSGSPGTGKTTLIKALLAELNVDPFDVMEINASRDNGVEFIRESITRFAETMGYGSMRYVFLDEADGLSPQAQGTLRGTIEKYSSSVRFLLTCNYPNKIMPALHSRFAVGKFHIDKLDADEYTLRLCNILINENIEFDMEVVDKIVQESYPDLRVGISTLQKYSVSGKLQEPEEPIGVEDYKTDVIVLFRARRFQEARELICKQVDRDECEDFFRFLYQNLDIWADTKEKERKCILIIRDGIVNHASVADVEINLSATLVELEMVANGEL